MKTINSQFCLIFIFLSTILLPFKVHSQIKDIFGQNIPCEKQITLAVFAEKQSDADLLKTTLQEELLFDDGVFEKAMGWDNLQGIAADGPFKPSQYPVSIDIARIAFNGVQAGDPFKIHIYIDSSGVADRPSSNLLVASAGPFSISNNGTFQDVDLRSLGLTLNSGNFFIGVQQLGVKEMWLLYDENGQGKNAFVDSDLDGNFTPLNELNPPVEAVFAIRAVVSYKTEISLDPPKNLHAAESSGKIILNWEIPANAKSMELAFDDEIFEKAMGWDNLQGIAANGPFQPSHYPVSIDIASVAFNGVQAGDPFKIHIYVDPSGAADRPSSNLLVAAVGPISISNSGTFQDVDLMPLNLTLNSGRFFIGVQQLGVKEMWILYDENGQGKNAFVDSDLDGIFTPLNKLTPPVESVFAIRAVVTSKSSGSQNTTISFLNSRDENNSNVPKIDFEDILGNSNNLDIPFKNTKKVENALDILKKGSIKSTNPILKRYKIYRSGHSPVSINKENCIDSVYATMTTYEDFKINEDKTYFYTVTALYDLGESNPSNEVVTEVEEQNTADLLINYFLYQNYPNPFNPVTTIKYRLPKDSYITLKVFNMLGQEVATLVNKQEKAGYYSVQWDASGQASGVYLVWLKTGEFSKVNKMLLMR